MKDRGLIKWIADDSAYYKVDERRFLRDCRNTVFSEMVFFAGMPHLWIDHFSIGNVSGQKFDTIGTRFNIAWTAIPNYGYSLFSAPESKQYEASLSYYKNCIATAARLKANGLILTPSGGMLDMDIPKQREYCISMLKELGKSTKESGIELVLGAGIFPNSVCMTTLAELRTVYESLPFLKFMLDTHAVYLSGDTISEWFDTIGDRIVHVQLQDGRYTGTSICGQGCYPMKKVIDVLAENHYSKTAALHMQSELYAREPEHVSRLHAEWMDGRQAVL